MGSIALRPRRVPFAGPREAGEHSEHTHESETGVKEYDAGGWGGEDE